METALFCLLNSTNFWTIFTKHSLNSFIEDKSKTTYFFLLILNLWKSKSVYNFGPLTNEFIRKYHSSIQILEKIIDKTLSPKVLSNNLSLWISYDSLSHTQDFNLLKYHIAQFHIGFKECLSFFKVFIFLQIYSAKLQICKWICTNISYIR